MKQKNKTDAVVIAVAVGVTALIYVIMIVRGLPCPIKYVSGISCAGCGMTRALMSVLNGRFAAAFTYHPLWVALPLWLAALAVAHFMKKSTLFNVALWSGAALFIAVWIIRMIDPSCDIVTFEPADGLIGRLIGGGLNCSVAL